jgi:prefoldin subunit 5
MPRDDQELREIEQRMQTLFVAFESVRQDFVRLQESMAKYRKSQEITTTPVLTDANGAR